MDIGTEDLIQGAYVVAMVVGILWALARTKRYIRHTKDRKEAELRLTESFSSDEFKAYLKTLKSKGTERTTPSDRVGSENGSSAG